MGRIIGGICAVSGILLVPLPMAILAKNFSEFFQNERREKDIIAKYAVKMKLAKDGVYF